MKKTIFLSLTACLLALTSWSCKEDPDLTPDYLVHSEYLSYQGVVPLYGPLGNTEVVGMKMWSGIGVPFDLINCELIGIGVIKKATDETIEVEQTQAVRADQLNPMKIDPETGYIFKGDLVYDNKKSIGSFYFYAYFSDFHTAPNNGSYNPRRIHYQRFK